MSPERRSLISLVVIAVALGVAWIGHRLQPPPPPPPGAALRTVFDVAPSAVRAIHVATWQGTLRAHRTADGWQVDELHLGAAGSAAEPGTPRPDQREIDQTLDALVREIVEMPEIDRFQAEGQPMRDFGLESPQSTITLDLDSGQQRTLQIGDLTITTSALYARVLPSPDVFQIGSLVFNNVAAALFRLRALAGEPAAGDGA